MINPIKSILPVTLIAIASSGCQAPSSPPPQSQRPTEPPALFVEAEFAAYDGAGNSTISGQAFLRTRGGEVRVGAGQQVQLYPVTSYTTQKVRALMATDGDVAALLYSIPFEPRAEKYRKSTIADAAGNFTLAWILFNAGRLSEAEKAARQAVLSNSSLASAYLLLAQIHVRQSDLPAVVSELDAYLRLDPNGVHNAEAQALRTEAQQLLAKHPLAGPIVSQTPAKTDHP